MTIRILCIILLAFSACKHDDTIGTSIIPENSKPQLGYSESYTPKCITVKEDSLRSDELPNAIVGICEDITFGKAINAFSFQLELPSNSLDFGNNPILDSVVLRLSYEGSYGTLEDNSGLKLYVHEVEDRLYKDSVYYSNKSLTYNSLELGVANLTGINIEDSVPVNGVNTAPHLRIRIDSLFGQDILNKSGGTELADNESFFDYFMGFHIRPDTTQGNAMLYLSLNNIATGLSLYYHTDDSSGMEIEFKVDNEAATHGYFYHNFNGSEAKYALNNPDIINGDSLLYLQSNAGLKAKLDLGALDSLNNVVINKAELVLTINDAYTSNSFGLPERLICLAIDSLGANDFISDQFESYAYYGGELFNTTLNGQSVSQYKFNLALHVQEVINKEKANNGIYLLTYPSNEVSDKVILKGNQTLGIKLNLTYTNIN